MLDERLDPLLRTSLLNGEETLGSGAQPGTVSEEDLRRRILAGPNEIVIGSFSVDEFERADDLRISCAGVSGHADETVAEFQVEVVDQRKIPDF